MINDTIHIDYTDGAPLAPDDVRVAMARSVQVARRLILRLDDSNATSPTPCDGWTALDIARHLVTVFRKVAAAPGGADLMAFAELSDVALDDLESAVDRAAEDMQAAWADEVTLTGMIDAPFGTMAGSDVLGVWAGETLVHSWDLAVAIGVEPNWPQPDTSISLAATIASLPESGRPDIVPFEDAVVLDDDRSDIDRLAGWTGRDVDAWR